MKNFKNSGGRGAYRPNNSGSRFPEQKEMHTAICAECGNSCQVPFKPRGDKPVYCSPCFSEQSEPKFNDRSRERVEVKTQNHSCDSQKLINKLDELMTKFDKIITILISKHETVKPLVDDKKIEKTVVEAKKEPEIMKIKKSKKSTAKKSPKAKK